MKTFLISDTHFGHANILNFKRQDGSPLRAGFENIKDHDHQLIENWNNTVSPEDKVYHLGDVGFTNFQHIKNIFDALNGTKVLIKGNHDNFKMSQYALIFKDVRATHQLNGLILSHIPIHPDSLARWRGNVHGHTHHNCLEDKRYMNVSVECINYTPIQFNEVERYFSV